MNWIKNYVRPKIRSLLGQKRDTPENMWIKDPESGEMVFYRDLEANQFVFPGSGHHHRMPADARLKAFFDGAEWEKITFPTVAVDPLRFRDEKKYSDRLKDAKSKGHANDSIQAGFGKVEGQTMVVMVQDMSFIGGSLAFARTAFYIINSSVGSAIGDLPTLGLDGWHGLVGTMSRHAAGLSSRSVHLICAYHGISGLRRLV